jgi:hypothetical protein
MHKLMLLLAVSIVAIGAYVTAAAADNAAPVHTDSVVTVGTPNPAVPYPDCRNYGYSFYGEPTFTVERRSALFYDDSGALVKEIRRVDFSGLVHKSTDLAVTVPYAATYTLTRDIPAGTATIAGLFRVSHPDGGGVLAMSAGRQTIDLATGDLLDFSGNFAPVEWEQAACAYLAAS